MSGKSNTTGLDLSGIIDQATQDAQATKLGGFVLLESNAGLFYLPTNKPKFVTEGVITGLVDGAQLVGAFAYQGGTWERLETGGLMERAVGDTKL